MQSKLSVPGEDHFCIAASLCTPGAARDRPVHVREALPLQRARPAHRIEGGYQVGRTVGQIAATRHRRLVYIHRVRILQARKAGRLQVHHHQVVLQQCDDSERFLHF